MIVQTHAHGFPLGYFIIRSVATDRLLDVNHDDVRDGAHLILWPEKESSLVQGFRSPMADNQVFFIDNTGALCSKHSGHAIDIQGQTIVLRHRRPITEPAPNPVLPAFSYDASTGHILATLDPPSSSRSLSISSPVSEKPPNATPGSKTYILHSVAKRAPQSLFSSASSFLGTSLPFLAGSQSTPQAVFDDGEIDLREDEVNEEERSEEAEVDDSLELGRDVKVSRYHSGSGGEMMNEHAELRRRWQIVPLRKSNARWTA